MNILGISAFYHDSAAALVSDGEIVAAAQEERFTRSKNASEFPEKAIRWCLANSGLAGDQIDFIAFYDKPFLKFERLIETYFAFAPKGFTSFSKAMPLWISEKLFQKDLLLRELRAIDPGLGVASKLMFSEHHLSHAASAFYPSPFENAAILTLDGVGEWSTTAAGTGRGNEINIDKEIHFPHSIGLLYAAFTYYTGFKVNADEYKVMGLAPYGEPKYVQTILDNLIDLKADGSFSVAQEYFDYCTGLTMTNPNFDRLFGGPPRRPDERITQREMDLAASIQVVTEETVLRLTRSLARETGMRNICLAGGVALNCVANGKVLRDQAFDNIWVQPAAGDAGGSIGAALVVHHMHLNKPRIVNRAVDGMKGAYLGPQFSDKETSGILDRFGAHYRELDEKALYEEVTWALVEEKVVGWFQGRMEFGPRALGNRSILGDARSPRLQRELNLRIKYRESFRPFAPAVPREDVADYFELESDSPYMLQVAQVRKDRTIPMSDEQISLQGIDKLNVPRSDIPAVTHIDYSARVQTVHAETNPRFHRLLREFQARTGSSVLVNTSFNVRDEPIVCNPEDAYRCFMNCEMDVLVIGNIVLRKEDQLSPLPSTVSSGDTLIPARLLACLKQPGAPDESSLERIPGGFRCPSTGATMLDVDGIPSMLESVRKDDAAGVTEKIKTFYEEYPFPSYEGVQEFGELVNRGQKNGFAQGLLDSIGHNKLILECGCGTGQMSQFLSLNNNHVLGIDLSISSLKLAVEHKIRNSLQRSAFARMNIFDLGIKDDTFDVVLSSGVLHHTKDARKAFAAIVRKAKPGGLVIVGLYNTFGRLPTLMRSKLIGVFGANIDSVVRKKIHDKRKAEIWIKDQYYNPHETWHSIDEVMQWFAENNIEYLNCYPSIVGSGGDEVGLLAPSSSGSKAARLLTQLSWLVTTSEEGALFIVSGRRKG
ncbi:putative NodU family carbamoyl transferase/2-polyprenyl-3-methyl-5-hydroxy-6-metoxy-1,4-benzoquinol methylase [Bradyrhizobium sp. USDA 3051]